MATYSVRYSDLKRRVLVVAGSNSAARMKAQVEKPKHKVISVRRVG